MITGFLKSIGLIDNVTLELAIDKTDFIDTLRSNIDRPSGDFFDIFSGSKNIYKGTVSLNGFELKRIRKFFDTTAIYAKSKGTFSRTGDKLKVDIEINGLTYFILPFIILVPIGYIFLLVSILTDAHDTGQKEWLIPFTFVHALFMLGIPYLVLRKGVKATKYNIERDIYFIVKDKLNSQRGI